MKMAWGIFLLFASGLIFLGGNLAVSRFEKHIQESQTWPTVESRASFSKAQTIANTDNEGDTYNTHRAEVRFVDSVNGATYTSEQLGWDDWGDRDSLASAQSVVAMYPQNKKAIQHYYPAKPSESMVKVTKPEHTGKAGLANPLISGGMAAGGLCLAMLHNHLLHRKIGIFMLITSLALFAGGFIAMEPIGFQMLFFAGLGFILFPFAVFAINNPVPDPFDRMVDAGIEE